MSTISGAWTLQYYWYVNAVYYEVDFQFNADGTYTAVEPYPDGSSSNYTGKWVQVEGMMMFNLDGGGPTPIYTANFAQGSMTGIMAEFDSVLTGCWYAIESTPEAAVARLSAPRKVAARPAAHAGLSGRKRA